MNRRSKVRFDLTDRQTDTTTTVTLDYFQRGETLGNIWKARGIWRHSSMILVLFTSEWVQLHNVWHWSWSGVWNSTHEKSHNKHTTLFRTYYGLTHGLTHKKNHTTTLFRTYYGLTHGLTHRQDSLKDSHIDRDFIKGYHKGWTEITYEWTL